MRRMNVAMVCLTAVLISAPAKADTGEKCKVVTGKATWTIVPAPNDPFGRILGPTIGDLKAAVTAIVTSLVPQPDGSLKATSQEVWALGAQDLLIFSGEATFTPIPDEPVGTVKDSLKLTVIGGTGQYAGASGTVEVSGTGFNIFGPAAGPGSSYFEVSYRGNICTAR